MSNDKETKAKKPRRSGVTIYTPLGAAEEYSKWACNLYNGCTNRCEYCYNRHCQAKNVLGKDDVTPKRGWTEDELFAQFKKEVSKWGEEIKSDGGLHFNFVSDPCLPETYRLNLRCIKHALENGIAVRMLTKMAEWVTYPEWRSLIVSRFLDERRSLIHFGFTLTGMDAMEPGAASNVERIDAMRLLHNFGYQTWASIEPVISLARSKTVIWESLPYCDAYKIGLLSGKKEYTPEQVKIFVDEVCTLSKGYGADVVFKKSVLDYCK